MELLKRERGDRLKTMALDSPPPLRNFLGALQRTDRTPVIAEIKKASPSAGFLKSVDPAELAGVYEKAGAACLSVLTDRPYFGGSLADLESARGAVGLPVLRKDFIIDEVQLYESRVHGADAVLLIVAALPGDRLRTLFTPGLGSGLHRVGGGP